MSHPSPPPPTKERSERGHARSIEHTAERSEDGGWRSKASAVAREREEKEREGKRGREREHLA